MPRGRRSRSRVRATASSTSRPASAGTYTVSVGGWTAGESAGVSYQLMMNLVGQQDNAPPLVDGPAPALQISLAMSQPSRGCRPASGPTRSAGRSAASPDRGRSRPGRSTADRPAGIGRRRDRRGGTVVGSGSATVVGIARRGAGRRSSAAVAGWPAWAWARSAGLGGQAGPLRVRDDPGRPERPLHAAPDLQLARREPGHADPGDLVEPRGRGDRAGGAPDSAGRRGERPPIPPTTASTVAEAGPPCGRATIRRPAIRRRRRTAPGPRSGPASRRSIRPDRGRVAVEPRPARRRRILARRPLPAAPAASGRGASPRRGLGDAAG